MGGKCKKTYTHIRIFIIDQAIISQIIRPAFIIKHIVQHIFTSSE